MHCAESSPEPGAKPIAWSPAPDVVIWLGANSANVDLLVLSQTISYEHPPKR